MACEVDGEADGEECGFAVDEVYLVVVCGERAYYCAKLLPRGGVCAGEGEFFSIAFSHWERNTELTYGKDGYLITHEWPLYVYDFLMMALTLVVCVSWYEPNIKPTKRDIEFGMRG